MKPNRARTGGGLREVEHLAGGRAAAGDVEQLRRDAQQRVGLDEGAVGQPHAQPVRRVAAVDHVAEPEAATISGA